MKSIFVSFVLLNIAIVSVICVHFVDGISDDKKSFCNILSFNLSAIPYEACVDAEDILNNAIVSSDTKVIVQNESGNKTYHIERLGLFFITGYIFTRPHSSISGFIEGHHFFGRVQLDSEVFYIENQPVTLIYLKKTNREVSSNEEVTTKKKEQKIDYLPPIYNVQYLFKKRKPTGKVCTLLIIIDNSFLQIIGNNNIKNSILTILHSLDQANSIFRSTDFDNDGIPDNIGFKVKYIVVIESEKSLSNILPPYSPEPIDGTTYLYSLSRHQLLGEVCLGVGFTGQSFLNRALGLSYTGFKEVPILQKRNVGGICERPSRLGFGENFNTLAISYYLQENERVSKRTADLCLAHELGHSFGSDHDLKPPCYGHLMTSHTFNNNNNRTDFLFSKCSKKRMLNVIRNKGHCLEDTFDSYCGNGLVEENEDCDCGLAIDCINHDLCCTRKGSASTPCKVNREAGFECHPSQGLCCELNCKYKNLSHMKLDCSDIEKKCPCRNDQERCDCGLLGECINNECHSKECTRINLLECHCPKKIHGGKCGTCCYDPTNKCRSARELTRATFAHNFDLNESVVSNQFENIIVEKFCNETNCTEFSFRCYDAGSFCVFKGDLGMCNKHSICTVKGPKKIFPKVANVKVSNSGSVFLQNLNVLPFCLLSVQMLQ